MLSGELIRPVLVASTAVTVQLFSVLALMLARYGKQRCTTLEASVASFELKLPKQTMAVLVAVMVVAPFIGPQFIIWHRLQPGTGTGRHRLMHGLVAQGRLAGSGWWACT